jgi:radical SAM superfamily enzyme YgiQ (UPF0313 family)
LKILLSTVNTKYYHTSFALKCLKANLGELALECAIAEFTLETSTVDIAEKILATGPEIMCLSITIWNLERSTDLVAIIKKIAPEITIVVGGPEVSYDSADLDIVRRSDFLVCGEGELAFKKLFEKILIGSPPQESVLSAPPAHLEELKSPYRLYTDQELQDKFTYVESSRGCPYRCHFCLSSREERLRFFPLEDFLREFDELISRGARRFKFLDRTFNANLKHAITILDHSLNKILKEGVKDLFLHFEVVPQRLSNEFLERLAAFPKGSLQLEVGIQTFNDQINADLNRKSRLAEVKDNITYLKERTNAHIHADLILGLPGEPMESIKETVDTLVELAPHDVQMNTLKILRGTPLRQSQLPFSEKPPYEILATDRLSFKELQDLRYFARHWHLFYTKGQMLEELRSIWSDGSPFEEFLKFSRWIRKSFDAPDKISKQRKRVMLERYLSERAFLEV